MIIFVYDNIIILVFVLGTICFWTLQLVIILVRNKKLVISLKKYHYSPYKMDFIGELKQNCGTYN